jgi:hypothetical protein
MAGKDYDGAPLEEPACGPGWPAGAQGYRRAYCVDLTGARSFVFYELRVVLLVRVCRSAAAGRGPFCDRRRGDQWSEPGPRKGRKRGVPHVQWWARGSAQTVRPPVFFRVFAPRTLQQIDHSKSVPECKWFWGAGSVCVPTHCVLRSSPAPKLARRYGAGARSCRCTSRRRARIQLRSEFRAATPISPAKTRRP